MPKTAHIHVRQYQIQNFLNDGSFILNFINDSSFILNITLEASLPACSTGPACLHELEGVTGYQALGKTFSCELLHWDMTVGVDWTYKTKQVTIYIVIWGIAFCLDIGITANWALNVE